METIRCSFCGAVMNLEEVSSYYSGSDWEYRCTNQDCKENDDE